MRVPCTYPFQLKKNENSVSLIFISPASRRGLTFPIDFPKGGETLSQFILIKQCVKETVPPFPKTTLCTQWLKTLCTLWLVVLHVNWTSFNHSPPQLFITIQHRIIMAQPKETPPMFPPFFVSHSSRKKTQIFFAFIHTHCTFLLFFYLWLASCSCLSCEISKARTRCYEC